MKLMQISPLSFLNQMINKPKKLIGIATYAHSIVNKPRILNIIIILAKFHLSIEY